MNPDWRKLLSGAGIRGSESDLTDEFAAAGIRHEKLPV